MKNYVGWWHDSRILAATGLGMEAEEQRAWEGHWNEAIVVDQVPDTNGRC